MRIPGVFEIVPAGHGSRMRADSCKLLLIVFAATAVRVLSLWIGRGEFTGWFNHTYYYLVETRGLLEQGHLPYPDMPLLFHLYALIARGLMTLGMEADAAVVTSTRIVMCLVPALIPLPVYGVMRNLNSGSPIRARQWALVLASGFLPMTLSYLPEMLQKNMLGLLLLWLVALCCQGLLRSLQDRQGTRRSLALTVLLLLAIVLTHYGTFAAAVLYAVAMVLANGITRRSGRSLWFGLLLVGVGAFVSAAVIWVLDAQRYGRLFLYLSSSWHESLVSGLFDGGPDRVRALISLAGIVVVYGVLLLVYWILRKRGARLAISDRIFWLANILFCGLLILPLLDEQLMAAWPCSP